MKLIEANISKLNLQKSANISKPNYNQFSSDALKVTVGHKSQLLVVTGEGAAIIFHWGQCGSVIGFVLMDMHVYRSKTSNPQTFFLRIFGKVERFWQFDSHPDHNGVQVDVDLF